jgi:hypothetical protein
MGIDNHFGGPRSGLLIPTLQRRAPSLVITCPQHYRCRTEQQVEVQSLQLDLSDLPHSPSLSLMPCEAPQDGLIYTRPDLIAGPEPDPSWSRSIHFLVMS